MDILNTNFGDTKTKYDRIGFSILFKKIATMIAVPMILIILCLTFATVYTNYKITSGKVANLHKYGNELGFQYVR